MQPVCTHHARCCSLHSDKTLSWVLHTEPVGLGKINAIFIFVHKFSVILLLNCSSSFLCCKISSVEVFSRSSVPWLSSLIVLPSCYWSRQLFSVTLKYVPLQDVVAVFLSVTIILVVFWQQKQGSYPMNNSSWKPRSAWNITMLQCF